MTLIVNGVDFVPYLEENGMKVTRADGDSADAGRTADYVMHRGRIATKFRLDLKIRNLWSADANAVLAALMPEYVQVTYTNPYLGEDVTTTMYSNNNDATIVYSLGAGRDLWAIGSAPLIER